MSMIFFQMPTIVILVLRVSLVTIVPVKRFIKDLLKNVNTENYLFFLEFYCTILLSKSYFSEPATCDFFIAAFKMENIHSNIYQITLVIEGSHMFFLHETPFTNA